MTQIHLRPGVLHGICKELDCSRDELAARMQVDSSTAFRIDSGRALPGPHFIGSLLLVTGRRFEDLFTVVEDAA